MLLALAVAQIRSGILKQGEQVWPKPKYMYTTEDGAELQISGLRLSVEAGTPAKHIGGAFEIYHALVPSLPPPLGTATSTAVVVTVTVSCPGCEKDDEELRVDITAKELEHYKLLAEEGGIFVSAENYFGVVRAFETLSQLSVGGRIGALPISIEDFPSYRYRGLMIDTSRHFLETQTIKTIVDGMAASKLNVLHWHIVDQDSFPLYLESAPELAVWGAYEKPGYELKMYNKASIQDVIGYANSRGVTVIPETDMPGHTYSWGLSPEWEGVVSCADSHSPDIYWGQLNPHSNKTYELIRKVLTETAAIFHNAPFFHVGFDEAKPECWGVSKQEAAAIMRKFFDFAQQVIAEASGGRMRVVQWDDMVFNGVYDIKNNVVQVWHGLDVLSDIITKTDSYAILSSLGSKVTDGIYLDCGFGLYLNGGPNSWCDPRKSWREIYDFTPPAPYQLSERVLGGEAAMWGELVDDTNIVQRIFPRASALGEALWMSTTQRTHDNPFARINQHRNLLVSRGVAAQPLQPTSCELLKGPGRDGACHPIKSSEGQGQGQGKETTTHEGESKEPAKKEKKEQPAKKENKDSS